MCEESLETILLVAEDENVISGVELDETDWEVEVRVPPLL